MKFNYSSRPIPLVVLSTVLILLVSCAPSKTYYKKPTDSEKSAIAAAEKVWGKKTDAYRVLIITDSGNMVMRLYNQTPLHRDNFVAKVKSGFYDSLLFHRVIKDFMIQGGDPQSRDADDTKMLGNGDAPGGLIPAEIRTDSGLFHKKGVLAAARTENPEKASSNCQFYIAQGKVYKESELDAVEKRIGHKLTYAQKVIYTSVGGIPHLDGNYTVYGELESGFDVLDKIAMVKTGVANRPVGNVRMYMFVVSELKQPKKK